MYRRKLALGAAAVAGLAATQIAFADAPSAPRATAAQGGLGGHALDPRDDRAPRSVGLRHDHQLDRPQAAHDRARAPVAPGAQRRRGRQPLEDARRRVGQRDALHARRRARSAASASRSTACRRAARSTGRSTSSASRRGAARASTSPTTSSRACASTRPSGARRLRLRAGRAKVTGRGSSRALVLQVRNRGNTVDPVGGSVDVSGSGGGRSGAITSKRILPGQADQPAAA